MRRQSTALLGALPLALGSMLAGLGLPVVAQTPATAASKSAAASPAPAPATLRRTDENVVVQAEDAFGASIGRETIGLYTSSNVRGFSPTTAGNVRIDGLYFDQVWGLNSRVRTSTAIRVGLSAQSYPFPAPTGVVDYSFRAPGGDPSLSVIVGGDAFGAASVEADAVVPLAKDTLSLGVGGVLQRLRYYNGTTGSERAGSLSMRWTPNGKVEILPFWVRSDIPDREIGPYYLPAGQVLPPRTPRRRFNGPDWAIYNGTAINYGVLARVKPGGDWLLRAGVFRSISDVQEDAFTFLRGLQPDGSGQFDVLMYPARKSASTSGEVRLSRPFSDGPRSHLLHLSVRGRDSLRTYGGAAAVDLGASFIGQRFDVARPTPAYGPLSHDAVRQWTAGLAYEGRWRGVGELSAGAQRSDYRKTIQQPGLPEVVSEAQPWLYNATAAVYLGERTAVYAGYTRGLEESGVAPQTAVNRDAALPAIITTQRDAGLRYRLTANLRLVAGVFDIRKPYFNLDQAGVWRELGEVRSQGVEMSLSGAVTPDLNVVLGAVLSRPRVRGEDVEAGVVGDRPIGLSERQIDANVNWRLPWIGGASIDLGVAHIGTVPVTRDSQLELPSRTLVNVGGRYRFRLGDNDATLRLSVTNLFDTFAYELRGLGAYDYIAGRNASLYLTVDF